MNKITQNEIRFLIENILHERFLLSTCDFDENIEYAQGYLACLYHSKNISKSTFFRYYRIIEKISYGRLLCLRFKHFHC